MENDDIHVEINVENKKSEPSYKNAMWGVMLVFVGTILMLMQLDVLNVGFNWWAIFIFLPAFGSLDTTWRLFLKNRKLDAGVRSSLGGAIILFTLGFMFLFDLDWSVFWPLMLIAPGIMIFLNGFPTRNPKMGPAGGWSLAMGLWSGLAVILLGTGFLLQNLGVVNLVELFGRGWWGLVMVIPALGAFVGAAAIMLNPNTRFKAGALILAIVGVACAAVGAIAYFGLDWNLITPIVFITAGVVVLLGLMKKN